MDIEEKEILKAIDQLTVKFSDITISFFRLKQFSYVNYEGFGSGFIVTENENHYLISSLHVVDEFYKKGDVNQRGQSN